MEKLVIIDGNSLINRAFYALPMLANFDGEISNAVFGFTNIIVKIINEIKPKYMCVAFDYGKKTFRNTLYSDYKGTRKQTPPELKNQFPILKDLLKAMNIKFIEKEGIEADDIIGTLSKKFDCENIIVTGDKDSFQLINNNTWVMFTKKGVTETINYTTEKLKQDYGIAPNQVVELKSLMGDSSDNIPGVKGIGEKTALSLLEKYKTLDGVYNNIENINGKVKTNLIENKEVAYLSHELATIKCDCDIEVKLEDLTYDFPFNNEVLNYFKRYQFNSLLKKKELFLDQPEIALINKNNVEKFNKINLKSIEDINNLKSILQKSNKFYMVFEQELSIFVENTEYVFESKFDLLSPVVDFNELLNTLKPVFENDKIEKVVFDYKDILHKLYKFNIDLKGVVDDVLIQRYLINNNSKSNVKLKDVANEQMLNEDDYAFNVKQLNEIFSKKIADLDLIELYKNIEMPLSRVLFKMEICGFKLDRTELIAIDEKYKNELETLTKEIYNLAGGEFNINSPKQLSEVLFDKLKLVAYNNKKRSTNIDVLNSLESDHPIIEKLIRFRKISKLYSTYVKAFENLMSDEDKIYTIFNQTLTATGRLSSSEPNLQNIPVRDEEGKNLRKIFIPSFKNGYIVSADYSQIELRLLASFSGDPTLIDSFKNGNDIHATTASQVFGVKLSDVTSQMRRDAKAINFGIIYGISDYGLSQNIGSTRKVAADYIKKYLEKYPQVRTYMDKNIETCRSLGYVKTIFGRIRYIPEINNSNYNLKMFGERAAMNMPLQGSASDIIKLAMIKVQNTIEAKKLKSKLILQIHDELIIDCDKDELEDVKQILKDCMENVVDLNVKLEVNISYGKNWFEAK